ncbi:MAG: polyprenyl diphosphate synthase [Candidatus Bipolaricaulia bacterium]
MTFLERIKEGRLPQHVALIMDGNGRWAEARGLPRTAGHRAGADAAERLVRFAGERIGLKYLTLFAFSSENWLRPRDEVEFLMDLLQQLIEEKTGEFVEAGIRLRIAGDLDTLPQPLRETVERSVRQTASGDEMHLTVAINYGGRQDLVQACARIAGDIEAGRLTPDLIDERAIGSRLHTAEIPDPDLIVRTSGELRLSNFLLWQAAYAELYFTDALWPDFTPAELILAIDQFQQRERRYGGIRGERE